MQTNLEEMTNNYNLACVEAVRDVIYKLATKWGTETVDLLNAEDYRISTTLYDNKPIIHAFITKNTGLGWVDYPNFEMQKDVQEAFDEMPVQVILAAMIHYGWEDFDQATYWRIY